MAAKDVKFSREARERILNGVDILANAVKVTPQDLAATVFRHLGIGHDAQWVNSQGRPMPVVAEGGRPIAELF